MTTADPTDGGKAAAGRQFLAEHPDAQFYLVEDPSDWIPVDVEFPDLDKLSAAAFAGADPDELAIRNTLDAAEDALSEIVPDGGKARDLPGDVALRYAAVRAAIAQGEALLLMARRLETLVGSVDELRDVVDTPEPDGGRWWSVRARNRAQLVAGLVVVVVVLAGLAFLASR